MADIYEFKGKDEPEEESCECEYCQLAHEYMSYIVETKSPQELFNVLRELVSEASNLTVVDFLEREIENNVELVHKLKYGFNEE